jgi:hypothetical protein
MYAVCWNSIRRSLIREESEKNPPRRRYKKHYLDMQVPLSRLQVHAPEGLGRSPMISPPPAAGWENKLHIALVTEKARCQLFVR